MGAYLDADEILILENTEFAMIIVLFLDHLGHLLEFLFVSWGQIGSDA